MPNSSPPSPRRWLSLLKPSIWPRILVATAIGLGLGLYQAPAPSPGPVAAALTFALFLGLMMAWVNDGADEAIDRLQREMFPRSRPRAHVDGLITRHALRTAATCATVCALAWGWFAAFWLHRPMLGWLSLASVGLVVAYSLPPFRFNYRGGGEWVEAMVLGLLLPVFAAHAVAGDLAWSGETAMLAGWVPLALASAIARGLEDEASDRIGGKRTIAARRGKSAALRAIGRLLFLTPIAWIFAAVGSLAVPHVAMPALVLLFWLSPAKSGRGADDTDEPAFLARLHRAIWLCGTALAAGLATHAFWN